MIPIIASRTITIEINNTWSVSVSVICFDSHGAPQAHCAACSSLPHSTSNPGATRTTQDTIRCFGLAVAMHTIGHPVGPLYQYRRVANEVVCPHRNSENMCIRYYLLVIFASGAQQVPRDGRSKANEERDSAEITRAWPTLHNHDDSTHSRCPCKTTKKTLGVEASIPHDSRLAQQSSRLFLIG